MGYSIILFLKRGSKKTTKSGRRTTRKRGRLHVGYCLRDWCKVFYEPTDNADAADEGEMPAKYQFAEVLKKSTSRSAPVYGEIAWLPHFDPKHIHLTTPSKAEKDAIHLKTLYDAYRYLDEDDAAEVARLEGEMNDPKHRRWASWFDEAKKWKRMKSRESELRAARRIAKAIREGKNPMNEPQSGSSDDSAYGASEDESDSDEEALRNGSMAPPARPPFRGNRSAAQSRKRRRGQSPNGSHTESSGHLSSLGRRPGQPRAKGPRHPFESVESSDGDMFMSGGGHDGIRGSFLRNGGDARARSASVLNGMSDSSHLPAASPDFDPRPPEGGVGPSQNEIMWVNADEYQDGEDEDDALQRAMRASVAPPEQRSYLQTPSATGSGSMQARETTPDELRAATAEAVFQSLLPDETEAQVEADTIQAVHNSLADGPTHQGQNTAPETRSARQQESTNRALPNSLASQGRPSFHATVEDESETGGPDGGNCRRGAEAG